MNTPNKKNIEQVKEEVESFGYFLLDEYFKGKNKKVRYVIIKDDVGYKYDVRFANIKRFRPSPFHKDNQFTLYNLSVWLDRENPEIKLCENNIYKGNKKQLLFFHDIPSCQEYFYMRLDNIKTGQGCPVCHGRQVGKNTSLSYLRPDLVKEWHKENKISPKEVTLNSNKRVYWLCSKCGYGEDKEWFVRVADRQRYGCPACQGLVVSDKNRLSLVFPDSCKFWHPTKNGNITPYNVSYGSNKKFWWICLEGHETYNTPNAMIYHNFPCSKCTISKGEKRIQNFLYENNVWHVKEKRFSDCKHKRPLPFDFQVKKNDGRFMCIEYHGIQHYEPVDFSGKGDSFAKNSFDNLKIRDKIKERYCKDNNIPLLIIPYWDFDNIESILKNHL